MAPDSVVWENFDSIQGKAAILPAEQVYFNRLYGQKGPLWLSFLTFCITWVTGLL